MFKCTSCQIGVNEKFEFQNPDGDPFKVYRCPQCGRIWDHNLKSNIVKKQIKVKWDEN